MSAVKSQQASGQASQLHFSRTKNAAKLYSEKIDNFSKPVLIPGPLTKQQIELGQKIARKHGLTE
jgi:hypothetical protein